MSNCTLLPLAALDSCLSIPIRIWIIHYGPLVFPLLASTLVSSLVWPCSQAYSIFGCMEAHFSSLHGTKSWPGAWESLSVCKTAYIAVRLWTHCTEMEISLRKGSNRHNLVPRQLFTCIEEKLSGQQPILVLCQVPRSYYSSQMSFNQIDVCVGTDIHDIINRSE